MNYNNIKPVDFQRLIDQGGIVLDVRSPAELEEGSITGYTQINFFEPSFKSKIEELDKSKTYLVYCRSGNRSSQACSMMSEMGFDDLHNLVGGIGAWNSSIEVI